VVMINLQNAFNTVDHQVLWNNTIYKRFCHLILPSRVLSCNPMAFISIVIDLQEKFEDTKGVIWIRKSKHHFHLVGEGICLFVTYNWNVIHVGEQLLNYPSCTISFYPFSLVFVPSRHKDYQRYSRNLKYDIVAFRCIFWHGRIVSKCRSALI
jgi:hypothetical protein